MITPNNSSYIAMHLDRLSSELLSNTYGKQAEEKSQKKCSCECGCTKTISDIDEDLCNSCTLETHKKFTTS